MIFVSMSLLKAEKILEQVLLPREGLVLIFYSPSQYLYKSNPIEKILSDECHGNCK